MEKRSRARKAQECDRFRPFALSGLTCWPYLLLRLRAVAQLGPLLNGGF
jgi:hypothetical protein